ncbi:MAG: uroporphyrinogen-III synthase [Burkholderiales bacterium]|nr:uroporphyrinogen-III synthase [Flavobacterium sp.]
MENVVRIMSTKKLLPNQKQYLLNANFSVIESDFIKVSTKEFIFNNKKEYLIFTSQNAVESVLQNQKLDELKPIKSFCVGEKTKALLQINGFEVVFQSEYVAELASVICNQYQKNSFTFFSGNLRRAILPEAMQLAKIEYEEIEVYETILTPQPVNSPPQGILFFSPSAVESYLMKNVISNEICFCIGKSTAETLAKSTQNIIIAHQPTVENVIIQCLNYYSSK